MLRTKLHKYTRRGIKRLDQLAEFLENKVPPDQFDLNYWVRKYDPVNECGTVCCAIGWCPVAFPDSGWQLSGTTVKIPEINGLFGVSAAAHFFDITVPDALRLFTTKAGTYAKDRQPDGSITKHAVIRHIHKFRFAKLLTLNTRKSK